MKLFPSLTPELEAWLLKQPVFFTASAPLHGRHVNVSPKGLLSSHFAVVGPNRVAYIDRTGSGCETIAHAYENGRLTIMFMSVGNMPRILRLFCNAKVVEWDEPEFPAWVKGITGRPWRGAEEKHSTAAPSGGAADGLDGVRAVIIADVFQVQTSCGYGVPRVKKSLYAPADEEDDDDDSSEGAKAEKKTGGKPGAKKAELKTSQEGDAKRDETSVFEDRPTLDDYWRKRAENNTVVAYQSEKNVESMDGLPGLRVARRQAGQTLWYVDVKTYLLRIAGETESILLGFVLAVLLYVIMEIGFQYGVGQ